MLDPFPRADDLPSFVRGEVQVPISHGHQPHYPWLFCRAMMTAGLTPCGNWKGPTQVTKKFADLKLSFLSEQPTQLNVFQKDCSNVITNAKWLTQQIHVAGAKAKRVLNHITIWRSGLLEFPSHYWKELHGDSLDTALESDQDDVHCIAKWPVHNEAAEPRDNIVNTHRVVPLPLYHTSGKLVDPSRYKNSVPGALIRVNFTLTHRFIPASATSQTANTFVADIKSMRILVDAPLVKFQQKRRTTGEEPTFAFPSKRSKRKF